ncbi:Protein of unknown function, partial [Gryllus bimaculatus]
VRVSPYKTTRFCYLEVLINEAVSVITQLTHRLCHWDSSVSSIWERADLSCDLRLAKNKRILEDCARCVLLRSYAGAVGSFVLILGLRRTRASEDWICFAGAKLAEEAKHTRQDSGIQRMIRLKPKRNREIKKEEREGKKVFKVKIDIF